MRLATSILLSILVGSSAPAGEPGKTVALILGEALKDDRAYQRLAWLTDRIGPRLSGSANLERADADGSWWVTGRGGKGTFLSTFRLSPVTAGVVGPRYTGGF